MQRLEVFEPKASTLLCQKKEWNNQSFLLVCFSERNGTVTVLFAILALILNSVNDMMSHISW